jgi:hypothetical protein
MSAFRRSEISSSATRNEIVWERSAADWEWLRTHPDVLAAHAGRWICVLDQQVVVSEADEADFDEQVRRGGFLAETPLIMRVPFLHEWQEVKLR